MHASMFAPIHAVTRVTVSGKILARPRTLHYRRIEFVDTLVRDELIPALEKMGHHNAEIVETAIVCNRCRCNWERLIHEAC